MLVIGSVFSQIFRSVIGDVDWTPLSIFYGGEPGVWYDPSDLTTLFQDSAGTTPVTTVGQSVGKMLDKSGRGNHATQATLAQRPTYQVDSTGLPYLSFDGVDDGMVTGTITPAINKVQVFAGVRKLSDATTAVVAELGGDVGSNNGSFALYAPGATAATDYRISSRGTVTRTNLISRASPDTAVLTGRADISAPTINLSRNGVAASQNVADQGTGNYLAYPLYLGRRAGATLPFNGRIYSLIVRFGANLAANQITSAGNWVNSKTGAY